jgi:hypothetical protein
MPTLDEARRSVRPKAQFTAGLPNRDILDRVVSIESLEPCEGKLSRTVLRGPERATAPGLPGAKLNHAIS